MKTLPKIWLVILSTIALLHVASGQPFEIKGVILQKDDSIAISGAHIYMNTEQNGVISQKNGFFSIQIETLPCELVISHIGYKTQHIYLNTQNISYYNIYMEKQQQQLPEFSVFSEPVICINPDDKYFITEFTIMGDDLITIAYKNRMQNRQYLILFDAIGTKISELPISDNQGLYKDPDGNCYITMQQQAWQIFHDSTGFFFSEPFEPFYIDSAKVHLAASKEDTLFIKNYYYNNQILCYHTYNRSDRQSNEYRTYINDDAIGMMSWGCFFDGNEFDQRFTQSVFFKPVQAPVYVYGDLIYIYNLIDGQLEIFSGDSTEPSEIFPLQFTKDKSWQPEILFDSERGQFYTIFNRKGITTIAEINNSYGTTENEITLNGYAHIEQMKVHDGILYFLYKEFTGDEYKRLYMSMLK